MDLGEQLSSLLLPLPAPSSAPPGPFKPPRNRSLSPGKPICLPLCQAHPHHSVIRKAAFRGAYFTQPYKPFLLRLLRFAREIFRLIKIKYRVHALIYAGKPDNRPAYPPPALRLSPAKIRSTPSVSSSIRSMVLMSCRKRAEWGIPTVYQARCLRISRTPVYSPL